jgi:hypothetical protein
VRVLGCFTLAIGIVAVLAAVNIEMFELSSLTQVNIPGATAQRPNLTIVSGLAVLAGLLMIALGRTSAAVPALAFVPAANTPRPCPLCTETINPATLQCLHCGTDIQAFEAETKVHAAQGLAKGWVAKVVCSKGECSTRLASAIDQFGFPAQAMGTAGAVAVGAYERRGDAERVASYIEENLGYRTKVMFREESSHTPR